MVGGNMGSIGDSSAVSDEERQFSQHQALITILQGKVGNPKLATFSWLDLACGKGQVISHLETNLDNTIRAKIKYFGYDIKDDYLKHAQAKASKLNLNDFSFKTGELANFSKIYDSTCKFDCITLINVLHEIEPSILTTLLFESVMRLSDDGVLFIYDMEQINPPELGAIPWNSMEIETILRTFFKSMGVELSPIVGKWKHKTCMAWNLQLHRDYVNITADEMIEKWDSIFNDTNETINSLIDAKYAACKDALESMTVCGASIAVEEEESLENLYNFWALSRVKGEIE